MNKPKVIDLKKIGDPSSGYISVVEGNDQIPFEIKRVYWTYFTPQHVERGKHAHNKLEQLIVAVSGIIKLTLTDVNNTKQQFILDNPNIGLYVPKGYWRDIQFSHNAVLLCLASEKYEEADYIRDINEFIS